MQHPVKKLLPLGGQPVAVVLVDRSHLDDRQLVSMTGRSEGSALLLDDGMDVLTPVVGVADVMPLPTVGGWVA